MIVRLSACPALLDRLTWENPPNTRHFHDRNPSLSKGGAVAYQGCCSLYWNEQKSQAQFQCTASRTKNDCAVEGYAQKKADNAHSRTRHNIG